MLSLSLSQVIFEHLVNYLIIEVPFHYVVKTADMAITCIWLDLFFFFFSPLFLLYSLFIRHDLEAVQLKFSNYCFIFLVNLYLLYR